MPRKLPDDPDPWRVVRSEYLFRKPPWLTLRQEAVELPGGARIEEYWVNEYPTWVNVVAVTRDRRVVLIRQYRHGIGQVHFELPAGMIEASDGSMEASARRELQEETGWGGGRWSMLMTLSANPALQSNVIHTYLAEEVEELGRPHLDATEDIRVHLVPLDDVPRLIDDGEMIQALHVAPLARYLLGQSAKGR